MKIEHDETIIEGKWILDSHNKVVGDDACRRVHDLKLNYLLKLATDESGWDILYKDPADGRFWELIYPQSEMHGGGPPTLRNLTQAETKQKYGV